MMILSASQCKPDASPLEIEEIRKVGLKLITLYVNVLVGLGCGLGYGVQSTMHCIFCYYEK